MSSSRARYTIPEAVLSTELDGEAVLLHMDTRRYFKLNASATVIWESLQGSGDSAAAVDALCREFEVEPDEAAREVERVLGELTERELVRPATRETDGT